MAPTFVAEYETAWDSKTRPKTVTATSAVGDVLVAMMGTEEHFNDATPTDMTASGTLSWTQYENHGNSGRCRVGIWGAPGIAASGWTLSGTYAGSNNVLDKWFGFNALRFSNANLTGAAAEARDGTSQLGTINITTTAANSAIAVICCDWSAVGQSVRDWNSASAGTGVEVTYYWNSSHWTVYVGYYPDAGAAGLKTVGCLVGAGGATTLGGHSIAAIEIKDAGGAPPEPPPPPPAGDRSALLSGLPYQLGNQSTGSAPPPSWNPLLASSQLTFL